MSESEAAAASEKALGKRKKVAEDSEFQPADAKDDEDSLDAEEKLEQGDTKVILTLCAENPG